MPSTRKRKIAEEEEASAQPIKLTAEEKRERRLRAAARFSSGGAGASTTTSTPKKTTPAAKKTTRRSAAAKQEKEESVEEDVETKPPPQKRARRTPQKAAAAAPAASPAAATATDGMTKAQLKEYRLQRRMELAANSKAGRRVEEAAPTPIPAAAAAPVAALTTVAEAPRPRAVRRLSAPFNSPVPTAASVAMAGARQVATGPRMPDFMTGAAAAAPEDREPLREPASRPHNDNDNESLATSEEEEENVDFENEEQEEEQQQQEAIGNDPDVQENEYVARLGFDIDAAGQQAPKRGLWGLLLLLVFAAPTVVVYFRGGGGAPTGSRMTATNALAAFFANNSDHGAATVCYVDTTSASEEEDSAATAAAVVEIARHCQDVPVTEWKPCPNRAVCAGGVIQECVDVHYALKDGDCVLSEASEQAIRGMVKKLEAWTAASSCSQKEPERFFSLDKLLEESPDMDWPLAKSTFGKLVEYKKAEDNKVAVALPADYYIPLSGTCKTKNALRFVLESISGLFVAMMSFVFSLFASACQIWWSLFAEIPVITLVFTIIVPTAGYSAIMYLRRRQGERQERQRLKLDVINVRELVYKFLRETDDFHSTIMIRDHISFDVSQPYHNNKKDRERLHNKVWPRVVADIRADNRIVKGTKAVNGVARECWKWAETTVH